MNPEKSIAVATVGRNLQLGMLYDCRNDSFISGVRLWDMKNIEENKVVTKSPQTFVNISLSDSLEEKTKMLHISASLSASFFAGLVKVEGSASYLNDRSSSMHACRATIQYSVTTKSEHLNLSQMGSVTYKKINDPHLSATHVVTDVEYGAEALMVFSDIASDEQQKQQIKGNIHAMLDKISLFQINAEGKVEMTDEERKKVQDFTCTFHGDFVLDENPANFEEAVKVYKELPKLLGPNQENVVPKKVWLAPLKEFAPLAPQLQGEVSELNCFKIQTMMQQLDTAQMRANDLSKDSSYIKATDITKLLQTFGEDLQKYMLVLKEKLYKILPQIKEGKEREEKLEDLFKLHAESPFTYSKMDGWLKERETEVSIIKSYINEACKKKSQIQVVAPEDFDKVLFDPQYESVWAFVFTSLGEDDPYLISLGLWLKSERFAKMQSVPCDLPTALKQKAQPWYRCPEIEQNIRTSLEMFLQYASDTSYPFIISYIHYPYNAGASVRWYKGGILCCVNYLNTYEPEVVDIGTNTMTFRASGYGAPQAISYLQVADGDKAQEKKVMWPKDQKLLEVLDLLPNTQYELWVDTEKDHIKMFTVVTKPN